MQGPSDLPQSLSSTGSEATLTSLPPRVLGAGAEGTRRSRHHLPAVLWQPHRQRLRRQHAQGVVSCHGGGELAAMGTLETHCREWGRERHGGLSIQSQTALGWRDP